jgi:hypothetical protein
MFHNDQASLAVINRKREPRRVLPTLVSFVRSYAFKDNGPGLCGTLQHRRWWSLTRMRRREPWAFPQALLMSLASESINDDSC